MIEKIGKNKIRGKSRKGTDKIYEGMCYGYSQR